MFSPVKYSLIGTGGDLAVAYTAMIYHAHEQYGCIDIHAIRISVDLIQTHPHYYITLIFSVNSVVNHAQNSLKYIILDASDVSGKSTHSLILAQLPV